MPLLYSLTTPAVVIFPIRSPRYSVNHRFPSGPAVMRKGNAPAVMPLLNSVMRPFCAHAPPDSKQSDASTQPTRIRSGFINEPPFTFVSLFPRFAVARGEQQDGRVYR